MEASTRRPCSSDIGLASVIIDIDAPGYSSGVGNFHHYNPHPFFSRLVVPRRRGSIRNLDSLSSCFSPRSGRMYDSRFEDVNNHPPHFLQACFLCKKTLGVNRDIFMYRGDTPFCSEECRQEQIDEDEANERKRNVKAIRRKTKKDPSSARISDYVFWPGGTMAAA